VYGSVTAKVQKATGEKQPTAPHQPCTWKLVVNETWNKKYK